MTIAAGTEVYNVDHAGLTARGVSLRASELKAALEDDVGEALRDGPGQAHLQRILTKLATTKFAQGNLRRVLQQTPQLTNWRVGEAVTEAFLCAHRRCRFPWPQGRDLRNPNASPAGADLVGFQDDRRGTRFAFGEAKTSSDVVSPPSVMSGRSGLTKQLESLRDEFDVTASLVRYLAHRKEGTTWQQSFDDAAKRYFANPLDVSLFGVLVRDVTPVDTDLRARARTLATPSRSPATIELRAIYLPVGSIANLGEAAQKAARNTK